MPPSLPPPLIFKAKVKIFVTLPSKKIRSKITVTPPRKKGKVKITVLQKLQITFQITLRKYWGAATPGITESDF